MGEISEMNKQKEEILNRVQKLMDWERWKAELWYTTKNPHFGETAPNHLVYVGRGHKVLAFIAAVEKENFLDDAPIEFGMWDI